MSEHVVHSTFILQFQVGHAWQRGRAVLCQALDLGRTPPSLTQALPAQVSAQASASAQPLPEPLHNIVLSFKQVPDAMAVRGAPKRGS